MNHYFKSVFFYFFMRIGMGKDILLFGVQGSCKGTQAKLLLEKILFNHKIFET